MNQMQKNIAQSFDKVKDDIALLRDAVIVLRKMHDQLAAKMEKPRKASAKKVAKLSRNVFVTSRKGDKYHTLNCPFARNIKQPITFNKKPRGYKACVCVN